MRRCLLVTKLIDILYLLQTIPHQFVTDNELFTYDHAILRRMGQERRVDMKLEFHKENPSRINHMNLRTNWRILAQDWQFRIHKMIRFKLVGTTIDPLAEVEHDNDDIPNLVPIFDVC